MKHYLKLFLALFFVRKAIQDLLNHNFLRIMRREMCRGLEKSSDDEIPVLWIVFALMYGFFWGAFFITDCLELDLKRIVADLEMQNRVLLQVLPRTCLQRGTNVGHMISPPFSARQHSDGRPKEVKD